MRERTIIAISSLLIACLVLFSFPTYVFADDEPVIINENNVSEDDVIDRTESTTTYQLSGGEELLVYHGDAVRYKDSEGILQDYDPELRDVSDNTSSNGENLEDYSYENSGGDSRQYFPEILSEETPVLMEKGRNSISMVPAENMLKALGLEESPVSRQSDEIQTPYESFEKKNVKAIYEGNDAALEYISENQGVKENLILKKRPDANMFRYSLKLDELKAVMQSQMKAS